MQVARLKSIFRYPVKGLSGERLESITLEKEMPAPFDRVFALARPDAQIDPMDPAWAKKSRFCMLMLDERLAEVETRVDLVSMRLEAQDRHGKVLDASLTSEEGRGEIEQFFWKLVPTLTEPPRLVRSLNGHFMDKPENVISLINLASVRALEEEWNVEIDPIRFRANLYIDGAKPWEEFDWIGRSLTIGNVRFRVDRRNGRCGATNVNPLSAARDLNIPVALRKSYGHKDFGVYLVAETGGELTTEDAVSMEPSTPVSPAATGRDDTQGEATGLRHICGGCYFIYEEMKGLPRHAIPPGTAFADLPEDFLCPDCGAKKAIYRKA